MSGLRLPTISNDLEFMRNKTVVLLGDSVDRNNLVQFCALLGEEGRLEKVMQESEISPSLPMGRERPDTYRSLAFFSFWFLFRFYCLRLEVAG